MLCGCGEIIVEIDDVLLVICVVIVELPPLRLVLIVGLDGGDRIVVFDDDVLDGVLHDCLCVWPTPDV
jgi:hypothetical protein